MLLASLLIVACEKGGEEAKPTLKVTSESVIEIGIEGGTAEISYTIANGADTRINVSEHATWIDTEVEASKVVVSIEANDGVSPREAKITLKYYESSAEIMVKQAGKAGDYDVEFKAKRFEGIYFGTEYSTTPNYYIILSDRGAASDGTPKANGTYYFFDMYCMSEADETYPILPNGNYEYDATNSYADLTFSEEGSFYAVMDADGKYAKSGAFKTASVSVTKDRFEAIIEFTSGEKHYVSYEGELLVATNYIFSTFYEDIEFNVKDAEITAKYYGDTLNAGCQNWFVEAKKGDDLYMVEVFNSNSESCDGLYQQLPTDSNNYVNYYIPGLLDSDGNLVGTWYAKTTNGAIKGDALAPMRGGMIRLVTEGDTLTIEYSCQDDAGNNITGTVSGKLTTVDARE